MASYTTSCSALPDLDGSCEIDDSEFTSYTSTNLGAATDISKMTGPELHAKITFGSGTNKTKYKIRANLSNDDWNGTAEEDDEAKKDNYGDYEDPWVATATGEPVIAAKATS